jgi:hypothetical protein
MKRSFLDVMIDAQQQLLEAGNDALKVEESQLCDALP